MTFGKVEVNVNSQKLKLNRILSGLGSGLSLWRWRCKMNTNFRTCECGDEFFTMKQYVSRFSCFVVGSFGEEADNGEMYNVFTLKIIGSIFSV